MRFINISRLAVAIGMALVTPAAAKEYNKPQGPQPEQLAKIQRTLSNTRVLNQLGANDGTRGDVVNTGCGALEIGNVQSSRPGQRVNRDIIITGDIINAPQNCRRR